MRHRTEKKKRGKPPHKAALKPGGRPSGNRPPSLAHGNRPAPSGPKPPAGGYFLWGRHAVVAALKNPERRIAALYATSEAAQDMTRRIDALPKERRAELPAITESERRRLDAVYPAADGEKAVHQGMLAAVWPLEAMDLEDFIVRLDGRSVRLLLLDQLSDPRNVGAIMRSALALGAQGIVTTHRNAPEESGALARAAAGALEHIPMIRVVNLARAVKRLQEDGIEIAGLAADGESDVESLRAVERLGIVMGAEGTGIRHLIRCNCDSLVRIDISDDSESLNVSIAAAIALYAARRD